MLEIISKLINSNVLISKMKTNIMLDLLFKNLEKDLINKFKTNYSQNNKTYLRGKGLRICLIIYKSLQWWKSGIKEKERDKRDNKTRIWY